MCVCEAFSTDELGGCDASVVSAFESCLVVGPFDPVSIPYLFSTVSADADSVIPDPVNAAAMGRDSLSSSWLRSSSDSYRGNIGRGRPSLSRHSYRVVLDTCLSLRVFLARSRFFHFLSQSGIISALSSSCKVIPRFSASRVRLL